MGYVGAIETIALLLFTSVLKLCLNPKLVKKDLTEDSPTAASVTSGKTSV